MTRERTAAGAARNTSVVCITAKPAMPMPQNSISASDSGNQADSANASTPSRKAADEAV